MTLRTLAAGIVIGYGTVLWWVLRREGRGPLLWVAALTLGAAALRLAYLHQYPHAYYEDELKVLYSAKRFADTDWVLGTTSSGLPGFLPAMFQGIPYPWIGQFWAVRGYSMVMSCLCVPLAFAVCRKLGCRVASSMFGAVLFGVLPWALLYGRVSQGGEFVFHELLVWWAIAAFVAEEESRASWFAAVLAGAFGMTLLLYSYPPLRIYWHLAIWLAVACARTARARLGLLCVAAVAFAAYVPALLHPGTLTWCGFWRCGYEGVPNQPWGLTFARKIPALLQALVEPTAEGGAAHGISAGAVHPIWLLPLVLLGMLLTGGPARVRSVLVSGVVWTALPAVTSMHVGISTHQLLPLFPVISLTTARGLDRLRVTPLAVLLLSIAVTWWSVAFYFSPACWTAVAEEQFGWCLGPGHGTSADECRPYP